MSSKELWLLIERLENQQRKYRPRYRPKAVFAMVLSMLGGEN
ncbi:hypothetical protein JCM19235_4364 [Vibrio maritimus]|uniref:Uncharacterized protein n=1 Tax=Vibrio maritimus TaxID=990268 RepID=A0A090S0Z4_9VIBR|nr:hypothetical protein JCM19235_4364 [Vibrio maritimus]